MRPSVDRWADTMNDSMKLGGVSMGGKHYLLLLLEGIKLTILLFSVH